MMKIRGRSPPKVAIEQVKRVIRGSTTLRAECASSVCATGIAETYDQQWTGNVERSRGIAYCDLGAGLREKITKNITKD
jgi:hypothetical protein